MAIIDRIANTPIPPLMHHLERDARGYPIPFLVTRGKSGKPYFIVNDELKRWRCIKEDKCAICGRVLGRGRWFVGGPMSAFHTQGAYIDPPLHRQCMVYALQVCPYLAVPSYARSIAEHAKIPKEDLPEHVVTMIDTTTIPEKPIFFVAVHARGQKVVGGKYLKPKRPYIAVEHWKDGKVITTDEAAKMVAADVMARVTPESKSH